MADKKNWMDSISETVDKATKAASEAWEGTADARKDAWGKTKAAVDSASEAIDQGVDKARESFKSDDEQPAEAHWVGTRGHLKFAIEWRAGAGSELALKNSKKTYKHELLKEMREKGELDTQVYG